MKREPPVLTVTLGGKPRAGTTNGLRQGLDPAILALVEALARVHAERDYLAAQPAPTPPKAA